MIFVCVVLLSGLF